MSVTLLHVRVHVAVAVGLVISFALEGMELPAVWPKWAEELEELSRTSREVLEGFDIADTGNSDGVYQDASPSVFQFPALLDGDGVHGVVSIWHCYR